MSFAVALNTSLLASGVPKTVFRKPLPLRTWDFLFVENLYKSGNYGVRILFEFLKFKLRKVFFNMQRNICKYFCRL